MSIVYCITCTANGRYYIGRTDDNKYERMNDHFSGLKRNKHYSKDMQSDYNKFGAASFEFALLEYRVSKDVALVMEWKYIVEGKERGDGLIYNIQVPKVGGIDSRAVDLVRSTLERVGYKMLFR